MKKHVNAKQMYLLAVALLALAVLVACCSGLFHRNGQAQSPAPTVLSTPPVTRIPLESATPVPMPTEEARETMTTVVYYQDNYGYLVPVTREIPLEDGVARATLSLMVKGLYNDMEAARLGLRTVLPEGTEMELDITSDKTAKIDLSEAVLHMADAASENTMVNAIVQTLTEFDTVNQVRITVCGKEMANLPNGTPVSGNLTRKSINLESTSLNVQEASAVTLYFPSDDGALLVPVTRLVYGEGDIDTAVLELAKGPKASGQLENALPNGVGLIGVRVIDGVAIVNFSSDFMRIVEESDGGRMALKALLLTCSAFDGVKGVRIQVDGQDYDPGVDTMSIPRRINDAQAVMDQAIATQSMAIFE